jgi:hypothetical protein
MVFAETRAVRPVVGCEPEVFGWGSPPPLATPLCKPFDELFLPLVLRLTSQSRLVKVEGTICDRQRRLRWLAHDTTASST